VFFKETNHETSPSTDLVDLCVGAVEIVVTVAVFGTARALDALSVVLWYRFVDLSVRGI